MRTSNTIFEIGITILLCALMATPAYANNSREETQAQLDAACEEAREKKLVPMREEFVEECVAERRRWTREDCVRFYADLGAQSGDRAPLFHDLPECVAAFEFQRSQRRR